MLGSICRLLRAGLPIRGLLGEFRFILRCFSGNYAGGATAGAAAGVAHVFELPTPRSSCGYSPVGYAVGGKASLPSLEPHFYSET